MFPTTAQCYPRNYLQQEHFQKILFILLSLKQTLIKVTSFFLLSLLLANTNQNSKYLVSITITQIKRIHQLMQRSQPSLSANDEHERFVIPEIIDDEKLAHLVGQLIETITGFPVGLTIHAILTNLLVFAVIAIGIELQLTVIFAAVNALVCLIISLIYLKFGEEKSATLHSSKNLFLTGLISMVSGFLWTVQICEAYGYNQIQVVVLSSISVFTSLPSILLKGVKEFSSPSPYHLEYGLNSCKGVRFLLPLPLLLFGLGSLSGQNVRFFYYVRLSCSLVFLSWTLGWISNVYSTYHFLLNSIINNVILGDGQKSTLMNSLVGMVLNCISLGIYYGWAENQQPPIWILIVGSILSSLIYFWYLYHSCTKQHISSKRPLFMVLGEVLALGILLALYFLIDFDAINMKSTVQITTAINLVLYVVFVFCRFLYLPRNCLGLSFNLISLNNQIVRAVEHYTLRMIGALVVLVVMKSITIGELWMHLQSSWVGQSEMSVRQVQYFLYPVMVYRAFKRSLSSNGSFSFQLSVFFSLILASQNYRVQPVLILGLMPPLPPNFYLAFLAPFTTPKKLQHPNKILTISLYLIVTGLSCLILLFSLGTLQLSMLFGLPMFFSVMKSHNLNQQFPIQSKQKALYQQITQNLPFQLFQFRSEGFYLVRISKYIILVEVQEQVYGFGEILDVKGLEVQEVTSCHSKEGQTIDKIVEETWGDQVQFFNSFHLWTVLAPLQKTVIRVPTQNDLQLTGLTESSDFLKVFKNAVLKALLWKVKHLTFNSEQLQQGMILIEEIEPVLRKQNPDDLLPEDFIKQISINFEVPKLQKSKSPGLRKKLPPLKQKNQVLNDFMDLIQESSRSSKLTNSKEESTHHLFTSSNPFGEGSEVENEEQVKNKETEEPQRNAAKSYQNKLGQINAALVLSLYHYSIGKYDYLNQKRLFNLINMEKEELPQVTFNSALRLLSDCLSLGFRLAIEKTIESQEQISLTDIESYQKNSFLGIAGSQSFSQAVERGLEQIWTLTYSKGKMSVKRLAKAQNQLYLLGADSCLARATWNNLKFELMYAANNNDERYSIQTHPYLLRNLWTQSCEEPFGYPSYHTRNLLNL